MRRINVLFREIQVCGCLDFFVLFEKNVCHHHQPIDLSKFFKFIALISIKIM